MWSLKLIKINNETKQHRSNLVLYTTFEDLLQLHIVSHLAFDPVSRMKVGGDEAVPVIGAWQQVWVAVVGFGLGGGKGKEVILVMLLLGVSGSLLSHLRGTKCC